MSTPHLLSRSCQSDQSSFISSLWPFGENNSHPIRDGKFVDSEFPPNDTSIGLTDKGYFSDKICWKRATEIHPPNSSLFDAGIHPTDVVQGGLGDCWFLASIACLAERPNLIKRIFKTQTVNNEGKYVLHFYKDGISKDITIDDFLPIDQLTGEMYGVRTRSGQLWVALLEKAFAKLHGSYQHLTSGECHHALQDMTGYPAFLWNHPRDHPQFWEKLVNRLQNNAQMLTAAIDSKLQGHETGRMYAKGLLCDHAYSVLGAKEHHSRNIRLVLIRNPWGKKIWNGDWSTDSNLWTPELKRYFNFSDHPHDGEFWMSHHEFRDLFDTFSVCDCRNDWKITRAASRFTLQPNHVDTPIIRVKVPNNCVLSYFGLHQTDKRVKGALPHIDLSAIILREPEMKAVSYVDSALARWAQKKIDLGPGTYTVVPYSSGAHFLKGSDICRPFMISSHALSNHQTKPTIEVLRCDKRQSDAAFASLLSQFVKSVPRHPHDPYVLKMLISGALITLGLETTPAMVSSGRPIRVFIDPSKSENLLQAVDSWQPLTPTSVEMPPENCMRILGKFIRKDHNGCKLGVHVGYQTL
uniref:Calpain family cysteine protease containing protein n=2 Tax=Hirondellea gigas TaxID=1518452 RepID=A0A2P2I930_9CRUS